MSFEKVFQYALRCYVGLEHKAVELNLLNKEKMSFNYETADKIFRKQKYEGCKNQDTERLDLSPKDCFFYTHDPKGLSFALNTNTSYKEPDYTNEKGYTERTIGKKFLFAMIKPSANMLYTSLPNLYSPIKGVVTKLSVSNDGCNYFINTLIIQDTLGYRHIFKYFYANIYPNIQNQTSVDKCLKLEKNELPIAEGREIQIGDFLGFLAYDNSIVKEKTYKELGFNDYFFFKYIIQDSSDNFLNPITFWQWKKWEHYAVYNAQNKESEIIYYFDSDSQIIEIAYKKEGEEHFERFFPDLHLHRFFLGLAYTHRYNGLTQAIYLYKLLFDGEIEKITSTDYPLFIDKPYGIISLNIEPSEGEILLDCLFMLHNKPLKESIVYFYNTDDRKIYQMPKTNDKGEVQCSIKKDFIHSNTLLYFSLSPDEFFDIHFGVCRSHQIMPKEKKQNRTTILLDLKESSKEQKHYFKLIESSANTTLTQWEIDRKEKLNSQRIIQVINREGKELFRLKDTKNLNYIEPSKIIALKLSHINEIQWFSKKAMNYYELISTSDLNDKRNCQNTYKIHYETWEEFGEFIEAIKPTQDNINNATSFVRYAMMYRSKEKGDWKIQKAKGILLTSMSGMPFWSDALGQLPFAINIYRGFLMLLQNTQPSLEESKRKEMAREATINIGYTFSDGGIQGVVTLIKKGFYNIKDSIQPLYQKEEYPPLDYLSYDNLMILRGICWVDLYDKKEHYDKLSQELESNHS